MQGQTGELFAGAFLAGDVFDERDSMKFAFPMQKRDADAAPDQGAIRTNNFPFRTVTGDLSGEEQCTIVHNGRVVISSDERRHVFAGEFVGREADDLAKSAVYRMDAAGHIENDHAHHGFLEHIAKAKLVFAKSFVDIVNTQDALAETSDSEKDSQREKAHYGAGTRKTGGQTQSCRGEHGKDDRDREYPGHRRL